LSSALKRVEEHESATRRLWYDSQIRLAQQAWESGRIEFAQEILEGLAPEAGGLDPRGFEWHYLRRLCYRDLSLRSRHERVTTAAAVAPDGKLLASAGFDRTVRLWDLPGGRLRAVLHGHTDSVCTVAFSPDGRLVASGGSDKTVRVWDVAGSQLALVFEGHTDVVRALAFDPTGALVISASNDFTSRGIDVKRRREAFSLPCTQHSSALALSRDGSLLASGDDWGNLTIWDVATRLTRWSAKGSDNEILGLAFSPDGGTLAAACADAKVRLWDPLTGQVTLELEGPRKARQCRGVRARLDDAGFRQS